MDGPVKTVCREEASWEEKGLVQDGELEEEAEVVSRLEYGEEATYLFWRQVYLCWADHKLAL